MTNNTNGDYDLANQGGQSFRQELNGILEDIKTINAGSTEPATKAAWMLWADTSTTPPKLKVWNGGVWLVLGDLATQMNHASVTATTQSAFASSVVTNGELVSNTDTRTKIAVGVENSRPLNPTVGDLRVNRDTKLAEIFTNSTRDSALGSWLSLYSSAKIDVFHCTSPGTTSSGTFIPEDGRTLFLVICTGGGGGAGGVTVHGTTPSGGAPNYGGNYWGSSGGGGAGTAIRIYTREELGASASYTIGKRGNASSSAGSNGGAGVTSVFTPTGTGAGAIAIEGRFGGQSTAAYNTTGTPSSSDHTSRPGWPGLGHNGMINCHGEKGEFQTLNNYTGATASGFNLIHMYASGGSTFWGKGPGAGADGAWSNATGGGTGGHGNDGVLVVLSW